MAGKSVARPDPPCLGRLIAVGTSRGRMRFIDHNYKGSSEMQERRSRSGADHERRPARGAGHVQQRAARDPACSSVSGKRQGSPTVLVARRVSLRIEVDDDPLAAEVGERDLVALLVGEGELRRCLTKLDHRRLLPRSRQASGAEPGTPLFVHDTVAPPGLAVRPLMFVPWASVDWVPSDPMRTTE